MANAAPPLLYSDPLPARRGRPPGAKAAVVRDARALRIHHFAFVRSSLLGLDLRASFERYLAWSETTTDLRYIQNRRDALLKQIIEAGRHLAIQHVAGAPSGPMAHSELDRLLDLLQSDASVKPAVSLPTLEDWVESEGMDRDGWSEADLVAEYKAAFGLDNIEALDAASGLSAPAEQRVRALNHLETLLAVAPGANDRLDAWFARPVVKCLRNVGLITLGDLVRFVNVYGYRWHGRVAGFGVQRAAQVIVWLRLQVERSNLGIADSVNEPKSLRGLKQKADVAHAAMTLYGVPARVPLLDANGQLVQFGAGSLAQIGLSQISNSINLAGGGGACRSHMANTLGASDDLQAVNAWLGYYQEKPATQRSYRKEVERFMLWCGQELKKPLSSVTSPDCLAYREFLKAVPASWVHPAPVARTDLMWRAFRGQPGAASQKQALVILQTLFGALCDAGYLVANPMKALMKGFDFPTSKVDIRRAFSEKEWGHVLQCLEAMPESSARIRLKCILELLVTSGIRLEELARARHSNLRVETLRDLPQTWVLTVTGKRNKTQEVPLNDDVVRLLATHGKDFMEADKQCANPDELPLIRTLHSSVAQWGRDAAGVLVASAVSDQTGSGLSASGIYTVLKRFFGQVAKSAGQGQLDPNRLERASTHWMRHTFVRQALVDGVPIEVVSELAGHASIDTTSIYATQELARKIQAIRGMKKRGVEGVL